MTDREQTQEPCRGFKDCKADVHIDGCYSLQTQAESRFARWYGSGSYDWFMLGVCAGWLVGFAVGWMLFG